MIERYKGGSMCDSPHTRMARMDEVGESYWLEDVELVNGKTIAQCDVVGHSEDWLTVREAQPLADKNGPEWTIRTQYIVRFRLVEG